MEFRLDRRSSRPAGDGGEVLRRPVPARRMADREGAGIDRGAWSAMADLGVLGLLVAEEAGGSGLGLVEAALVFEQVGYHLVPGPVLWTVLAAPLIAGGDGGAGGRPASSPRRRATTAPWWSTRRRQMSC